MSTHDPLVECVRQALLAIQAGEDPDVDTICVAHPELIPEVEAAVRLNQTLYIPAGKSPLEGRVLVDRYALGY